MRTLALLVVLVSGCAAGYDGVRQTLTNGETLVIASVHTIKDASNARQQQILKEVEKTCTGRPDAEQCVLDEGEKKFQDLKVKRDIAVKAVRDSNAILKAAADLLPLVEATLAQPQMLVAAVAKVPSVLAILAEAVSELGLLGGP